MPSQNLTHTYKNECALLEEHRIETIDGTFASHFFVCSKVLESSFRTETLVISSYFLRIARTAQRGLNNIQKNWSSPVHGRE